MLSEEELDNIRSHYKGAPDYNYTVQLMKEVEELKRIIRTAKRDALNEVADRYDNGPPMEIWTDMVAESLRDAAEEV